MHDPSWTGSFTLFSPKQPHLLKPELLLHNSSLRTQPLLPVRQPCAWVMLWDRHVDMRPGPGLMQGQLSNGGVGLGLKPPSVLWLLLLMFQWLLSALATRSSSFSSHPFARPQLHSKWLHVVLKDCHDTGEKKFSILEIYVLLSYLLKTKNTLQVWKWNLTSLSRLSLLTGWKTQQPILNGSDGSSHTYPFVLESAK